MRYAKNRLMLIMIGAAVGIGYYMYAYVRSRPVTNAKWLAVCRVGDDSLRINNMQSFYYFTDVSVAYPAADTATINCKESTIANLFEKYENKLGQRIVFIRPETKVLSYGGIYKNISDLRSCTAK